MQNISSDMNNQHSGWWDNHLITKKKKLSNIVFGYNIVNNIDLNGYGDKINSQLFFEKV